MTHLDLEAYCEFRNEVMNSQQQRVLSCLPRFDKEEIGRLAHVSKQAHEVANVMDAHLSSKLHQLTGLCLHEFEFISPD